MQFTWYGVKPVLLPLLEDLPIITLQELASDPRSTHLDVSHPFDIESEKSLYQKTGNVVREAASSLIPWVSTDETNANFRHVGATAGHDGGHRSQSLSESPD
jgi:hypothetical protein